MTRTLIADDEEDMRVLVRAAIQRANQGLMVACEAADGVEAVETWRTCRPDVVILDLRMPRKSGIEAAGEILEEEPEQAIVLFSAFLTDGVREDAERLGIRACLGKDQFDQLPATLWAVAPS